MAASKNATKKPVVKKIAAKKTVAKKAPAKKVAAKKAPTLKVVLNPVQLLQGTIPEIRPVWVDWSAPRYRSHRAIISRYNRDTVARRVYQDPA